MNTTNATAVNVGDGTSLSNKLCDGSFDRERVNLESYQLVWLNENNTAVPDEITLRRLRYVIDYLKVFANVTECQHYLQVTADTTTFLVIAIDKLSKELLPQIHDHKNIWSVYRYSKVRGILDETLLDIKEAKQSLCTELNQLLDMLSEDVANYLKLEKCNATYQDLFTIENTTQECYDSFWPHFITTLCYIPYPDDCRFRLTTALRTYYHGKDIELNFLNEFERDYLSKEAIGWYTRPSPLYNILNRALRQHNRSVMLLFGFFIKDIYRHLKIEYEEQLSSFTEAESLKVYRGQFISKRELRLTQSTDNYYGFISNSFFSTTFDRQVALLYRDSFSQINDNTQSILFEIEIDIRQTQNYVQPFASIAHLSTISDEAEILFMPGTRFIVHSIIFNQDENIWLVKISLAPDQLLRNLQEFDGTSNRRTLKNCISSLPISLMDASLEQVTTIFNQLMNFYPNEKWILPVFYRSLISHSESYNVATSRISAFNKALNAWLQYIDDNELNCYINCGEIHKQIAHCYEYTVIDLTKTIEHLDSAICFYETASEKEANVASFTKANIYGELANLYKRKTFLRDNIDKSRQHAIKYHEKQLQCISACKMNYLHQLANVREQLGKLYEAIPDYDMALKHYETCLTNYLEGPKIDFVSIPLIIQKIIDVYIEKKNDISLALKFQLIKYKYNRKENELKATDTSQQMDRKINIVAKEYVELAEMYMRLQQYQIANENLMEAMKFCEQIKNSERRLIGSAIINEKLADNYYSSGQYTLTYEHLTMALIKWQQTSRIERIANIQEKLDKAYSAMNQSDRVPSDEDCSKF